jgi:hypothetical protein
MSHKHHTEDRKVGKAVQIERVGPDSSQLQRYGAKNKKNIEKS